MNKNFLRSVFAALAVIVCCSSVFTYPNQPPATYCGLPGGNDCSSCHSGTPNTGAGLLSIKFSDTTNMFHPDSTYIFTVQLQQPGISTFGFEMGIVDSVYKNAGSLSVINAANSVLMASGAMKYVGHKNANSNNMWTIRWKAPSAGMFKGNIIVGCAALAANSNGRDGGDQTYTKSITLKAYPSAVGISADPNRTHTFSCSPIGNNEYLFESTGILAGQAGLMVFGLDGKVVVSQPITLAEGTNQLKQTLNLSPGIYIARLSNASNEVFCKFFVQ